MTHHRRRSNGTGTSDTNEAELSPAQRYAAFKQAQAKGSVEAGANLEEMVNKRKDDAIFGK